ncbi:MAG: methyltransferase domain-containing protein [Candidatus Micrarchaeales archaeon]
MLKLSKRRVKGNMDRLAKVSDIEFKEMSDIDETLPGHLYNTRNFERFLPTFVAINSILEAFRDQGKVKEAKKAFVLQIAGGYCQLGSLLDYLGVEHVITDFARENLMHGKNNGTETGVVAEAGVLPFRDGSVNIVVSDHFLCSNYAFLKVCNELSILEEIKRVLKQEGLLVISQIHGKLTENDPFSAPHNKDWAILYDGEYADKQFAILQKRK